MTGFNMPYENNRALRNTSSGNELIEHSLLRELGELLGGLA
jgi:hypothetical protein